MSVSSRGPRNILVIDRVVVPINAVADDMCIGKPIPDIMQSYRLSEEEVFEAVQTWVDIRDATSKDYIEMRITTEDGELSVMTTGITDWLFLNLIVIGKNHHPDLVDNDKLYTLGLEQVIIDACYDVKTGSDGWEISDIHRIVFQEFCKHVSVDQSNVDDVLKQILGDDYVENNQV
jgi:hypothetical protein